MLTNNRATSASYTTSVRYTFADQADAGSAIASRVSPRFSLAHGRISTSESTVSPNDARQMLRRGTVPRILTSVLWVVAQASCGDGGGNHDMGNRVSQVLFVADQDGNSTSFLINPATGALKDTGLPTGLPSSSVLQLSSHPSRKLVYATFRHGSTPGTPTTDIMAYAITSSGTLSAVAGSPFTAMDYSFPYSVDPDYGNVPTFDPAGDFLYVGSRKGCQVFSIDQASGAISPIQGSPFAGPTYQNNPMASNCGVRVGSYLIGAFGVPDSADFLYEFAVDPTSGALTLTNNQTTLGECCGRLRTETVSGNILLTSYFPSLQIRTIDSTTGAFSQTTSFGLPQPWKGVFAMDPSGRFIFFASPGYPDYPYPSNQPGALYGYALNSSYSVDGTSEPLTPLSAASTTVGFNPVTMTFDQTGRFLYVVTFGMGETSSGTRSPMDVYAFMFDSISGTLTAVPDSPYALMSLSPDSYSNQMLVGQLP